MMKKYFPDSCCEKKQYLKQCEHEKSHVIFDDADDDGVRPTKQQRKINPENVEELGSLEEGKKVNVASLLSSPNTNSGRDYLVNSSGEKVKVRSIVGKYILIHVFKLPVKSDSKKGLICWALKRAIPQWPNFQLVVVTKMNTTTTTSKIKRRRRSEVFNCFVSAFPNCLAIPISDPDSYERISGFIGWKDGLLLDPSGIALRHGSSIESLMSYGAESFPFTYDHFDALDDILYNWLTKRPVPLENLLGLGLSDFLFNPAANTISVSDLKNKLVGLYLYVSGEYMDAINRAYQHCQQNKLELEIVLVYLPVADDPNDFITCTHAALRDKGISSWWLLPFNDSTSRRLWQLCERSKSDELIIVGPQGQYLDTFAANIVTHFLPSVIKDMYPYAAEAFALQETERLNNLTLASFFSSPQHKSPLFTQKGCYVSLKEVRRKIVCLFIANCDSPGTLKEIRSWCHSNKRCKATNVALVLVALRSSKLNFTTNSSPELSWLWDSAMPWLICCPDPVVEASIIKHTTLRSLSFNNLTHFTFGEDGKLLSIARPSLSGIEANRFPEYPLYELVLEAYTETFQYEREYTDWY